MKLHKKPQTKVIYGESGASKTTQLYHFARWYHARTKKRIRLISCSGGGWEPFDASGLIDSGIVQALDVTLMMQGVDTKLAFMKRLSEGYWPIDSPSGKGNVGDGEYFFAKKPECMTIEAENIGAYLIEDLTSLGKLLLGHLSEKDSGTGFKHSFTIEEDGYIIGGLQEGHYGLVQNEVLKFIQHGFGILPVDYMLMTALVGSGTDKRDKTKLFAPQLVGSASTSEIPSWFGDCLYLRDMQVIYDDGQGNQTKGVQKVMHIRDYINPDDEVPYKAKVRCMPELIAKLEEKYPEGYVELKPEKGIIPFLNTMEKWKQEYLATVTLGQ